MNLLKVYKKLYAEFGPQHWWPVEVRFLDFARNDPDSRFEICVGAILTQGAAWTNVEKALVNLHRARLMSPERMKKVHIATLKKAIRSAGYYNQKAKKLKAFVYFLDTNGGFEKLKIIDVPKLREALLTVLGIGRETADSIILYAFEKPIFVIDTYTKRLLNQLGVRFKEYDDYRLFFEKRLPRNVKMWNEYHALIVAWGKNKRAVVGGSKRREPNSSPHVPRRPVFLK